MTEITITGEFVFKDLNVNMVLITKKYSLLSHNCNAVSISISRVVIISRKISFAELELAIDFLNEYLLVAVHARTL